MSDIDHEIPQPIRFGDIEICVAEQTPLVLLLLSVIQQLKKEKSKAVYRLPDGTLRVAQRLADVSSHFGPGLRQYVLLLVHQNHVTQNRVLEQLRDIGIDIAAGQIFHILLDRHEAFQEEKDQLLPAARELSAHLHCDDTSARHQGKAAVCTHLGNELFTSFTTTGSKSRLNFLRLLCQPDEQYRWCEEAAEALRALGVSKKLMAIMENKQEGVWMGLEAWQQRLKTWRLSPRAKERSQTKFWELYASLKEYRQEPTPERRQRIEVGYDSMCQSKNGLCGFESSVGTVARQAK